MSELWTLSLAHADVCHAGDEVGRARSSLSAAEVSAGKAALVMSRLQRANTLAVRP